MGDEPKIEPKWEEDVPYCIDTCGSISGAYCLIDGEPYYTCPHAVKQMAEKIRELEGGWAAGVTAFAWWKDGVQYVGTCGTTLKDALAKGDDT